MRRTTLTVKHLTSFRHKEQSTNVDQLNEEDRPNCKRPQTGDKTGIALKREMRSTTQILKHSTRLDSRRPVDCHVSHNQKQNAMLWIDTNHNSGTQGVVDW